MLAGNGEPIVLQEKACEACIKSDQPRTVNKITVGTAIASLMRSNQFDQLKHKHLIDLIHGTNEASYSTGPGTNLKRYLSWFASETTDCACKDRVRVMNTWGPDLCTQNIDIILDWLEQSASERKLPFVRFLARILVSKAISEARND
jgi:hypothetical protein